MHDMSDRRNLDKVDMGGSNAPRQTGKSGVGGWLGRWLGIWSMVIVIGVVFAIAILIFAL